MSFQEIEFKEFVTLQRGFDLPKTQMKDGEVPVLGSNCVIGYHNEAKVEPPGVVTGRSGTLGAVQYIDEPYWPHNTSLWVKDFKDNLPSYVYYKLQTLQLERFNGGASVPTLNRNVLDTLKIKVPDLPTQERIAEVLSAYDDLIENNRRRIRLLEESARLLYREWFVHFRFPGHEHIPRTHSGLPEGWKKATLGEIAETNEQSYSKKDLPELLNYIDISSVTQGIITQKTTMLSSEAPGRARRIAKHGDVIWSNVRPNLKAYSLVMHPEDIDVFSTGFTVMTAKKVPYSYIYCLTTTDAFVSYLVNHTTGASYPAVRPDDFERCEIAVPPQPLLEQFHEFCAQNFEMIYKLNEQNQKLAAARDILLPRLMNGEVAV